MAFSDFLPVVRGPVSSEVQASHAPAVEREDPSLQKDLRKLYKVASFTLGYTGMATIYNRRNFEVAPFDLERIRKAIDTDSFIKQGFNKYQELIWKEGWDISSENDDAADYVRERIDYMEMSMHQPFEEFLEDVADQLVKYGNVFIAKARGDLGPFFPQGLQGVGTRSTNPVVGYYVVPAHTIEIERNQNNKPVKYRQRFDSLVGGFQRTKSQPTWTPEQMIHICVDRVPGMAFGTPFMVAVLDDVVALRAMEEDIQNLVHKELFPLYKYKVGTEMSPAEEGEIEEAARQLEYLASDGGLVVPERHDIEVIGGNKQALDAEAYLNHFIIRVCAGLGLSPHHLGILGNANRSVTDRLDIALYDKVKTYQKKIAENIRLHILNELLLEGGFNPFRNPSRSDDSDRCEFKFHEIDVDTQVKKETHAIQKWTANAITLPELRNELSLRADVDEEQLFIALQNRHTPVPMAGGISEPKDPSNPSPSKGGKPNRKDSSKGAKNVIRPANQNGKRTSPNIRRDYEWALNISEILGEEDPADIQ